MGNFECGAVIEKYTGSDSVVEIPAEINGLPVTKIGAGAFDSCAKLTKIRIPDSITAISDGLFNACGIKKFRISDSVTEIGEYAFSWCESLTEIHIPDSVRKIGKWAFVGCKNLRELRIPGSVTEIDKNLIYGCFALESIYIDGVKLSDADIQRIFGDFRSMTYI